MFEHLIRTFYKPFKGSYTLLIKLFFVRSLAKNFSTFKILPSFLKINNYWSLTLSKFAFFLTDSCVKIKKIAVH